MSFLAPFYLLGAFSIAAPILFHLIRRQPRGAIPISSLMFLRPTPPRLTRRSRLDDWPLLLIRACILLLIAVAFSRPFWPDAATTLQSNAGRRLIVLIDTSASMRREDLWDRAQQTAIREIQQCGPADAVAVHSFDDEVQVRFATRFDPSENEHPSQSDVSEAVAAIRTLKPSWRATRLADALQSVTQWTASWGENGSSATAPGMEIVLISDMQPGEGMEALQALPWPSNVSVRVQRMVCKSLHNAAAFPLSKISDDDTLVVRVMNEGPGAKTSLSLDWHSGMNDAGDTYRQNVEVLSGQMQTVRMKLPEARTAKLVLSGDDQPFDNQRYYLSPELQTLELGLLDKSLSAPQDGAAFFLEQVPLNDRNRQAEIKTYSDRSSLALLDSKTCPLFVIIDPSQTFLTEDAVNPIADYVASGGTCLFVLANPIDGEIPVDWLMGLETTTEVVMTEATLDDYTMISKIDFRDPVFESFAPPQYSDFTKIRIWSYRRLRGLSSGWKTIASFDTGDPMLMRQSVGEGSVWLMTAGWQPSSSQFALSSKFAPWFTQLFKMGIQQRPFQANVVIGETSSPTATSKTQLISLDEQLQPQASSDNPTQVDAPGFYRYIDGEQSFDFAANLAERESRTEPIEDDRLEQLGVPMRNATVEQKKQQMERRLRHHELETKQGWWQILILASLAMIAVETLWGGRRARQLT